MPQIKSWFFMPTFVLICKSSPANGVDGGIPLMLPLKTEYSVDLGSEDCNYGLLAKWFQSYWEGLGDDGSNVIKSAQRLIRRECMSWTIFTMRLCLETVFEKTFFKRIQNENNSDVIKARQCLCSHGLQDFQYSFADAVKASNLKQNITSAWALSPVIISWGKRGKTKWCHSLDALAKMQTKVCSIYLVFV